eukprot:6179416-Pleurochrysis_carterae.AAC.1
MHIRSFNCTPVVHAQSSLRRPVSGSPSPVRTCAIKSEVNRLRTCTSCGTCGGAAASDGELAQSGERARWSWRASR